MSPAPEFPASGAGLWNYEQARFVAAGGSRGSELVEFRLRSESGGLLHDDLACGGPGGASSAQCQNYSAAMRTFIYLHCSDLGLARSFYSDVLGLTEIYFSEEDGTVGYQAGELQITIAAHPDPLHADGWAKQLGWEGGSAPTPSWGVECGSTEFRSAVAAAQAAGVEAFHSEPLWVGYWSFPVKDPMGYTVEITTPQRDAWPPSSMPG